VPRRPSSSDGMRLGLGTGSTVDRFLVALAARDLDVAGVPTSRATEQRCAELGIRLLGPADVERLDLVVDGADELTRDLVLTKGGGGALLREKVVAAMGERFAVIATSTSSCRGSATRSPCPSRSCRSRSTRCARARARGPRGRGASMRRRCVLPHRQRQRDPRRTPRRRLLEDPEQADVWLTMLPGVVTSGSSSTSRREALLGRPDGSVETLSRPGR
jgi:ribose 5-phosphate isomerase A